MHPLFTNQSQFSIEGTSNQSNPLSHDESDQIIICHILIFLQIVLAIYIYILYHTCTYVYKQFTYFTAAQQLYAFRYLRDIFFCNPRQISLNICLGFKWHVPLVRTTFRANSNWCKKNRIKNCLGGNGQIHNAKIHNRFFCWL